MPLLQSDGCKYLKYKVKVVGKILALPIIKEKLWPTSCEMVMSWKLSEKCRTKRCKHFFEEKVFCICKEITENLLMFLMSFKNLCNEFHIKIWRNGQVLWYISGKYFYSFMQRSGF